jgi:hypothetical protein
MTDPERIAIDLTEEERKLMSLALNEYGGLAKRAKPLLIPVLGLSTEDEWYQLLKRLELAIDNNEPLSDLDWARALFLTEISFASDLVGAGLHFGPAADEYWFRVLRSIQQKISTYQRFLLLLQNASYSPAE